MIHALVVDVEDWYHPLLLRRAANPNHSLIWKPTIRLLDLLDERGVTATFMVVGEIAQREPKLIAEIAARGHEIGCHTFTHTPLSELDRKQFGSELERAEQAIVDACGKAPKIFRGPSFGYEPKTAWVAQVLAERGYVLDNSLLPSAAALKGWARGPRKPFQPFPGLWEVPASTSPGLRVPYGGSIYLRILPKRLILHWVKSNEKENLPSIFYFHPWELLESLPPTPGATVGRWLTELGGNRVEKRLSWLLDTLFFAPLSEVFLGFMQK